MTRYGVKNLNTNVGACQLRPTRPAASRSLPFFHSILIFLKSIEPFLYDNKKTIDFHKPFLYV